MYSKFRAAVAGSINMDIILNMDCVPAVGENELTSVLFTSMMSDRSAM